MEIEELLEQIAIAEPELLELQEDLQKYDADSLSDRDEYNEIRLDIQGVERNLESLRDRLQAEREKYWAAVRGAYPKEVADWLLEVGENPFTTVNRWGKKQSKLYCKQAIDYFDDTQTPNKTEEGDLREWTYVEVPNNKYYLYRYFL